ncbi:hypothetical protein W97_05979 [Coniosporium apollinis CBS 100218]|uniref:Uncharacterized protein n=1 Tax=Coniosporium apollinis (strain CBS 100218) TaxID=1168221 RepID=R7YY03_CONA1|nr:uncharacterized protein W97_05979 [Coniosporium apollinis CBS 100218]EON66733.1 hypothetical protein W97_05979 [Coniosporium apollinis CBS 100218]
MNTGSATTPSDTPDRKHSRPSRRRPPDSKLKAKLEEHMKTTTEVLAKKLKAMQHFQLAKTPEERGSQEYPEELPYVTFLSVTCRVRVFRNSVAFAFNQQEPTFRVHGKCSVDHKHTPKPKPKPK